MDRAAAPPIPLSPQGPPSATKSSGPSGSPPSLKASFGRGARQALILLAAYAVCIGSLDLADAPLLETLGRSLARALVLVLAVFTLTSLLLALFRPGARSRAVRLATICALLVPGMVGFDEFKVKVHEWRAQSLAERTAPLVQRLQEAIEMRGLAPLMFADLEFSGVDLSLDDFPGITFNDNTFRRARFPSDSQGDLLPPDPPRFEQTGYSRAPWELEIPVDSVLFGSTVLVCFPKLSEPVATEFPAPMDRFRLDGSQTLLRHGDLRVDGTDQAIGFWGLILIDNWGPPFD